MRRISKDDCRNAAIKLSNIAFDKQNEENEENFKALGDELIGTYIPKPLMALSQEYPDLFTYKRYVIPVRSEQGKCYSETVYVPSNIINPLGESKVFLICDKVFKKSKGLYNKRKNLIDSQRQYKEDVSEALWTLRTKQKISESFPEALPYLDFGDSKTNLPAPNYEGLRNMLKIPKGGDK